MAGMMLHCGGENATYDDLKKCKTPERLGKHHNPKRHDYFVDTLKEQVHDAGLTILALVFGLACGGTRLFFSMDVDVRPGSQLDGLADKKKGAFSIVGRKDDMMKFAIWLMAGWHTFVCDNLALLGDAVVMKKKQTLGLSLHEELATGLVGWTDQAYAGQRDRRLAAATPLTDDQAKLALFHMFELDKPRGEDGKDKKLALPKRYRDSISENYLYPKADWDDCTPRSVEGFEGAGTRAVEVMSATPKIRALRHIQQFSNGLARSQGGVYGPVQKLIVPPGVKIEEN